MRDQQVNAENESKTSSKGRVEDVKVSDEFQDQVYN